MQGNPNTNVKVVQALASAAHVADVTPSTGIDCQGFTELLIIQNLGTYVGSGTATVTLTESSVSDGTGDAFAAWTGSAFTAVTTSNDAGQLLGRVQLRSRKRYIKPDFNYTGNGSSELAPTSITFVLLGPDSSALCAQTYDVNTT